MPLFDHKKLPDQSELGLWEIHESEDWFREHMLLFEEEKQNLNRIRGAGRRVEWLAARYLLHQMSNRDTRGALIKDEFGKPHLEKSPWQISLSHSNKMAAAIAGPHPVGIDIQVFVPKIDRLAHKFMREIELDSLHPDTHLEHLHLYWCAKEALYKIYGRKLIDFKKHLLVHPFEFNTENGRINGTVKKEGFHKTFQLNYQIVGDYYLVFGGIYIE